MNRGPNATRKVFPWEGKLMPSILRGSKAHNERVLAEQRIRAKVNVALAVGASPVTIPAMTAREQLQAVNLLNNQQFEDIFERAQAVALTLTHLRTAAPVVSEKPASTIKPDVSSHSSALYCHESLDDLGSPQKQADPVLLLSPFSKAKHKARSVGVNLSEECRGVYTTDELDARINFLAEVTATASKNVKPGKQ